MNHYRGRLLEAMTMTNQEMTAVVNTELEHIPKGPYEFQGMLRSSYSFARRKSLGQTAASGQTVGSVLQECVGVIRKRHPNSEMHYDRSYFGE
jgi:hypothetical protein